MIRLLLIFAVMFQTALAKEQVVRYQTSFGKCPSESTGKLTLKLIQQFEKTKSLRSIKNLIVDDKLDQKYFLSSYKVKYNPITNFLMLTFECPAPLMKVHVYKENGVENYEAILVAGGKLFDPTYEVLLRAEKKLKKSLPFFALPVEELNTNLKVEIASIMSRLNKKFRHKIAEVIFSDSKQLTFIMSLRGHSSSAFLGKEDWYEKVLKLKKIVNHMEKSRKIPSVINITNKQKVVVKF